MRTSVAGWMVAPAIGLALLVAGAGLVGEAATYTDAQCARCHKSQVKALADVGGKHADLGCTSCHEGHPPEVQKPYPACTACHEPHSADPAGADCAQCHRAHEPTRVTYAVGVPSAACAPCHQDALAQLAAGTTKHAALSCTVCHRAEHKATMGCGDCHGRQHPAAIMARFSGCADCHHTAHDLNHWPEKG